MKLLIIVNCPAFFLSHRLPVALGAQAAGFDVHVATPDGPAVRQINDAGLIHHAFPLSRSGSNPFHELRSIAALYHLFRQMQPDLVHLVTIKPVLYGGLAARLARVPAVVAAISGLGAVFTDRRNRGGALRMLVQGFYRLALRHKNIRVIFQNPDDRRILEEIKAVRPSDAVLIRGSGVDLTRCAVRPEPEGIPVVTFASRLLKDKGVVEFVEAAKILHAKGVRFRFLLAGDVDPGNPTSVSPEELTAWSAEGIVEVVGFQSDVAGLFAASSLVVLPSYYREGLPKVLVEAAACGRAVITTDVPGCRDAIVPDETGLLVPARNAEALAAAIRRLIENPALRASFGQAGRQLAEREFGIEKVVNEHLAVYRRILK